MQCFIKKQHVDCMSEYNWWCYSQIKQNIQYDGMLTIQPDILNNKKDRLISIAIKKIITKTCNMIHFNMC